MMIRPQLGLCRAGLLAALLLLATPFAGASSPPPVLLADEDLPPAWLPAVEDALVATACTAIPLSPVHSVQRAACEQYQGDYGWSGIRLCHDGPWGHLAGTDEWTGACSTFTAEQVADRTSRGDILLPSVAARVEAAEARVCPEAMTPEHPAQKVCAPYREHARIACDGREGRCTVRGMTFEVDPQDWPNATAAVSTVETACAWPHPALRTTCEQWAGDYGGSGIRLCQNGPWGYLARLDPHTGACSVNTAKHVAYRAADAADERRPRYG